MAEEMDWAGLVAALVPKYAASAEVTSRATPVQLSGQLADGRWWYFRSRYSHLGLGVGATREEAIFNWDAEIQVDYEDPLGYGAGYLTPVQTLPWLSMLLARVA